MKHLFTKLNYLVKIMRLYFILIILLSILSCKKRRDEPKPNGIIKGNVFSIKDEDYKQIRGAIISLNNKSRNESHRDGTFWIKDIKANTYNVTVSHPQYHTDKSQLLSLIHI